MTGGPLSPAEVKRFWEGLGSASAQARLSSDGAFFDWYTATIDEDPTVVVEGLASWLDGGWRSAPGLNGYSAGAEIVRNGDVIARVSYGGNNGAAPSAWASGADTAAFVECVRSLWPRHKVTRVDAAYDFKGHEPWPLLLEMCQNVAKFLPSGEERKRHLSLDTLGDWLVEGSPKGRTLYLGSRQSSVFARLYEKGKQMRGAFPDQADKFYPGWVRLELEVKPQKRAGYDFATLSPAEVWGAAAWARQLHADVFGSELEAAPVTFVRPSDDARAWTYLLKQYGPMLRRRIDVAQAAEPDADPAKLWAALGLELGAALGAGDPERVSEVAAQPDAAAIRDRVERRRRLAETDGPAPFDGERIGPDTRPDVRFNVHERARIASDVERARVEADAAYRWGPEDL